MTATLTQVRNALKAVLETIDGLNVYAFPPGQVQVPAAVVAPGDGEFLTYQTANGGAPNLNLTITLFVQRTQDRAGSEKLDGYLATSGATSVYNAVELDQDLGGAVQSCIVTGARNFGTFSYGELSYFGADLDVEVYL